MHAIVADDHPLYREAVRLRLERLFPAAEIDEAAAVDELMRLGVGTETKLDLILLDLHMPGMAGAEGIGRVVAAFPGTPVVMMSGLARSADVLEAVRAGARGFLPKTMAPDHFAAALSLVIGGGTYLPAEVLQPQASAADAAPPSLLARLTPREQQVLVRLATGAPNKEIGRDLGLAEVTVKLHVRQILKKIGARNRSEAAAIASKAGLM
ncbi:MAG: response regulator [Stellaceae bacterium]